MFILPDYRSQSIGSHLTQEFIKWRKTQNVQRIKVVATAGNESGIIFYKKNGFENYGQVLELDLTKDQKEN